MNFAVVGLAFTHPYSYTEILHRMGHRVTHVWDDVPQRVQEFSALTEATPVASPEEIPTNGIDGVIATGRFPERVDHATLFLERGQPVYSSKPMVTSLMQLHKLEEVVGRRTAPYLSTSVLRFAPAIQALKRYVDGGALGTLVSVRAVSAHDISMYMREPNIWQDDPQRGGGTIITMGLHALEMLGVLVGTDIRMVWCRAGRRVQASSLSEDVAVIGLEWESGLLGVADVPCGIKAELFGVEIYGSEKSVRCSLPSGEVQDLLGGAVGKMDHFEEFGYVGTMKAFVEMCRTGRMPVPFEESAALARVLLAARESAATGEMVAL